MARLRDDGVATVWAAIVITAVAALLAAVLGVGGAVAARHRAAAAADLAALAGAAHAWSGREAACAEAAAVAARMDVELLVCDLAGLVITVRVARQVPGLGRAEASARAGPVDAGDFAPGEPSTAGRAVHGGSRAGSAVGPAR